MKVHSTTTPQALKEHLLSQLRHLNPRIFISYSSKDKDFVDELHEKLKRSGQHVWLNTESIPKGEAWHEEMTAGLSETDVLVLIVSPDSMASKWVKEEWQTFLGSDRTILPVLHKDCDVPQEINRLQMIKTDKQDWYYELLQAIEAIL